MSGASRVVNWADALEQEDRQLHEQLYEQSGEAEGDLEARDGVEQGPVQRSSDIMPRSDAESSLALAAHSEGCYDATFVPEYTPHPPVCTCGEKHPNVESVGGPLAT